MNTLRLTRIAAVALIFALIWEMVYKLGHSAVPESMVPYPFLTITWIMTLLVSLIVLAFLVLFYRVERDNPALRKTLVALVAALVLRLGFRLALAAGTVSHGTQHLVGGIFTVLIAMLLLTAIVAFFTRLPATLPSLHKATLAVMVLYLLGLFRSVIELVMYARFLSSGAMYEPSGALWGVLVALFLATHLALIWFLYRYQHDRLPPLEREPLPTVVA